MIVVFEGPDASGKSELARRTAARYEMPSVKTGPSGRHLRSFAEFAATLYDAPPVGDGGTPEIVFDRWATSEWLYGPLFRHDARINATEHAILLQFLFARDGVLVVCLPPIDVCVDTWRADPKPVPGATPDERQIVEAYRAWEGVAARYADLVWDYTSDGPIEELWRRIWAFRGGR